MRRAQKYRTLILSGGIAMYAIGMWFAWFDGQQHVAYPVSHGTASAVGVEAGSLLILFGTVVQGLTLTNARRALGGAGMIVAVMAMVWLWSHGIDFLFLRSSMDGWSSGFVTLPLLLVAGGTAWLLMAMGSALPLSLRILIAPIIGSVGAIDVYLLLDFFVESHPTSDLVLAPAAEGHVWPLQYSFFLLMLSVVSAAAVAWRRRYSHSSEGGRSIRRLLFEFVGAVAVGLAVTGAWLGAQLTLLNVLATCLLLAPPIVVMWESMHFLILSGPARVGSHGGLAQGLIAISADNAPNE